MVLTRKQQSTFMLLCVNYYINIIFVIFMNATKKSHFILYLQCLFPIYVHSLKFYFGASSWDTSEILRKSFGFLLCQLMRLTLSCLLLSTSTHNASKQKPTDDTINLLEGVDSFRCHLEIYPVVAQEPNQPYDILDTYDALAVERNLRPTRWQN